MRFAHHVRWRPLRGRSAPWQAPRSRRWDVAGQGRYEGEFRRSDLPDGFRRGTADGWTYPDGLAWLGVKYDLHRGRRFPSGEGAGHGGCRPSPRAAQAMRGRRRRAASRGRGRSRRMPGAGARLPTIGRCPVRGRRGVRSLMFATRTAGGYTPSGRTDDARRACFAAPSRPCEASPGAGRRGAECSIRVRTDERGGNR